MQSLGIQDGEIKKFADANYWLDYFPPLAVEDLNKFGIHVSCFNFNLIFSLSEMVDH